MSESLLLTYAQAAKLLNCSVRSVRRLVSGGNLVPVYLLPRSPRIVARSLEDYVERLATTQLANSDRPRRPQGNAPPGQE